MSKLGDNLRREKYLRQQQSSDVVGLLSIFEKPDTAKLVREVAIALMGGNYVCISCAGGGSVSSETAGMVARRTRRTRTSDSVAGSMLQRLSRLPEM